MPGPADATDRNQEGSVIFIALMVLVIMTVVGLMMSQTVVTENFIVRNQGIYKQNIYMTEAALMEGLQRFMQLNADDDDIVDVNNSTLAWINSTHTTDFSTDGTGLWYMPDSSTRILDAGNSLPITTSQTLGDRGEAASGNLRTGFVGWLPVTMPGGGSESLAVGANKPVWRQGRLLAEYVSNAGGGMMRMEIGVRRKIILN
jgi:hypothetical protein